MSKKFAYSAVKSPNPSTLPEKSLSNLKVSVLCPTRGRPENAQRLSDSIEKTAQGPVGVHFYCDDNDPLLGEYRVRHITGPDYMFAMKCHVLAKACDGDILMMCGDDAVFETKGWDMALRSVYKKWPDGIWCASCWDGTTGKPESYTTDENNIIIPDEGTAVKITHPHPAIGRQAFEILGYIANPMFRHFCTDPWLTDMFKGIGRFKYFPDVLVAHRRAGLIMGVDMDDTFHRMRPGGQPIISARDRTVYSLFKRYQELDSEMLKIAIKEQAIV